MGGRRARDPVTWYAEQVVRGREPAGRWHRLACERHLHDRRTAKARGLAWRPSIARDAIQYFGYLRHYKGEWAGDALILSPWQEFVIGSVVGWLRLVDGLRRYRTAFVEVPRGQGKSTMAAALGLYLTFFDDEPAADGYCIATKRDQARIVHETARQMVLASPALRQHIQVQLYNLHSIATVSRFQPLGADADTTDGLRPHVVIADEVHAQRSSDLIDIMQTGMGSRRQPLMFEITTAGVGHENVWWSHREYSCKVLQGILTDETWFAFIACADDGDDWTAPDTWRKANPNYDVTVKPGYLAAECERAKAILTYQNTFRRLHCGQLVEQLNRYIDMTAWDAPANAAPLDVAALEHRACYLGLDLSSKLDLTAAVLVFPDEDGGFTVLPEFWIPADNIEKRVSRDRVPYDVWTRDEAVLRRTSGNVIDLDFIRKRIGELGERFSIQEVAVDPWNATQMAVDLQADGFKVVEMRQGFKTLSEPTTALQAAVMSGKLRHGGHPILRWNASNLVVREDANQNVAPDKAKATERIDGVVALIMGLGRAIVHPAASEAAFQAFVFQAH